MNNDINMVEYQMFLEWKNRFFSTPSPDSVKKMHLLGKLLSFSKDDTIFIETGTFMGTTSKLVKDLGYEVITIELSEQLYFKAKEILQPIGVTCLFGDSRSVLKSCLSEIDNKNIFFWLDGHYSGGVTAKGISDTPVAEELMAIESWYKGSNFRKNVFIKIDDVRVFNHKDYPSLDQLVSFANRNFMSWTIEQDSFMCSNVKSLIFTEY